MIVLRRSAMLIGALALILSVYTPSSAAPPLVIFPGAPNAGSVAIGIDDGFIHPTVEVLALTMDRGQIPEP